MSDQISGSVAAEQVRILLDLNRIEDYRTFLKIKALPVYSFVGREAIIPREYAARLGLVQDHAPSAPSELHPGLFDYQRDISKLAIRKGKYAVFALPGLGKTLIMFEFARHAAAVLPPGRAVLIVSPLMVTQQTIGEAKRFYGDDLPIEPVRARDLPAWLESGTAGIGITNYEAITDRVKAGRLGALILDESSLLKSHYGKWGSRLIELGKGLRWKLCLTGTPAPNDRIEYANHAVFLDQFPTVNSFLAKFFVNRGETCNRWELKAHALRPFYRDLSHWCIFLSNPAVYGWKDNTAPLPPINTHIVEVGLTAKQRTDAMTVTGNLWGNPGGIGERGQVARIAKSGKKAAFVGKLIKESNGSCIAWCKYNAEQEELAALVPTAANISGDTPDDDRLTLIGQFQRGERQFLISKPKIMGFGLNLQIARRMVFSTVQDSYEEYYQAVKRANRYGSTHPLDVYIPVSDLERPMVETVLRKAAMVQSDTEEQEQLFKELAHAEL